MFERAFNIRCGDDLLTVTDATERSPITVNASDGFSDFRKCVEAGESVVAGRRFLRGRSLAVFVGDASIYSLPRTQIKIRRQRLIGNIALSSQILRLLAPKNSIVDEGSPLYSEFKRMINGIGEVILAAQDSLLVDRLIEYLGMGYGYTPSGDDFVVGFLASSRLQRQSLDLEKVVSASKSRTRWTSSKLIEYSRKGDVTESLHTFIGGLFGAAEEALVQSLLKTAGIGHSSGFDSMVGALVATVFSGGREAHQAILKLLE